VGLALPKRGTYDIPIIQRADLSAKLEPYTVITTHRASYNIAILAAYGYIIAVRSGVFGIRGKGERQRPRAFLKFRCYNQPELCPPYVDFKNDFINFCPQFSGTSAGAHAAKYGNE